MLNIKNLFSLHEDQASPEVIDATIRDNTRFNGTNLWVLMFAIAIASVGLNVNSTAVIIGAMLISPLMGPIIGAGYGAGIRDFALIRKALRNLTIFMSISLLTSTLYFYITPLQIAQSELLARTTPTIWDVLIAFFGGAAGMVGLTRKEKSTVIPGVAIATALMPPLCTVGYGLATWQPDFFLGAFYLFAINGVFIATATLCITRILGLPLFDFKDAAAQKRGRIIITLLITATLIPSVFLASRLVSDQLFTNQANHYIDALIQGERGIIIADHEIKPKTRTIRLSLVGGELESKLKERLEKRMSEYGLSGVKLDLNIADLRNTKTENSITRQPDQQMQRVLALETEVRRLRMLGSEDNQLAAEIRAQLPQAKDVTVASAAPTSNGTTRVFVIVGSAKPLPMSEHKRLERWLGVRLPNTNIKLITSYQEKNISR